jgi:hypothetical protein
VHITGKQAPTCSNFLPLACTLLSEKLRAANYSSHFVGTFSAQYGSIALHVARRLNPDSESLA